MTTYKQKEFAKELVLGEEPGNATKAALKAYNVKNKNAAAHIGCVNLKKPVVIREIDTLMEEHNIDGDLMMKRLKEGLNANIVSEFKGDVSKTKVPDLNIRHKYWQDAAKIMKLFPAERTENVNIDIELEKLSTEELVSLFKQVYGKGTISGVNQESPTGQG